jgi:hypothetical protein
MMDLFSSGSVALPRWTLRWMLHGLEVRSLGPNLLRRGPAAAWEIYRLSIGAWLALALRSITTWQLDRQRLAAIAAAAAPGITISERTEL